MLSEGGGEEENCTVIVLLRPPHSINPNTLLWTPDNITDNFEDFDQYLKGRLKIIMIVDDNNVVIMVTEGM